MIQAVAWAFAQTVGSASAKSVLVALSDNANVKWEAWPSVSSIEAKTELDRKTIITVIQQLEHDGWIIDTGQRTGATKRIPIYKLQQHKQSRKRNSSENGIVPLFPETVPFLPREPSEPSVVAIKKSLSRCSEEESVSYCVERGLQKEDGEWFWNKCEGCGWKNNGKAIVDWKRTIIAWQLNKIFPSQKQVSNSKPWNRGRPAEESKVEREYREMKERMTREKKQRAT